MTKRKITELFLQDLLIPTECPHEITDVTNVAN